MSKITSLVEPFMCLVENNQKRNASSQKVLTNRYIEVINGLFYCLFMTLDNHKKFYIKIPYTINNDLYDVSILDENYIKVLSINVKAGKRNISFLQTGRMTESLYLCCFSKIYNSKYKGRKRLNQTNFKNLISKLITLEQNLTIEQQKILKKYIEAINELISIANEIPVNIPIISSFNDNYYKITDALEEELDLIL